MQIENEGAFYNVYSCIFDQPFAPQKKTILLTSLMAGEPWGWKVIGITAKALDAIAETEFKKVDRVCRAHLIDRRKTADALFARKIPREQFFRRFLATDKTVIALKRKENTLDGFAEFLPVDGTGNLFSSKLIAFSFRKDKERQYLRELHAAYKSGKVAAIAVADVRRAMQEEIRALGSPDIQGLVK